MKITRRELRKVILTEAKEAKGVAILQKIASGEDVEQKDANFLQKAVGKKVGKGFNLKSLKDGVKILSVITKLFKDLTK